ncbi:hypothetical protein [Rhodoferax ferrireducens]|uniref:hypothetical protein n=1 Tax=Rhodoferax ferrireducens TaxID=192843 RepID=UPI000E0D3895|nr:hypothetical protein [Rhodoferax ferrireducens]
MNLNHFTIQAGARCHAVYAIPGTTGALHSIGDTLTQEGADKIAREANELQEKQERALVIAALHPADRPIPKGFYTDLDAA